jgi:hypothetical protein
MSLRSLRLVSVVAIATLAALPVFAGDNEPGGPGGNGGNGTCTPEGAWLGHTPDGSGPAWTIVYTPESYWQGSFTLNLTGFDGSFGGAFPVTTMSPFAGTWVRTGPRTAAYTMIAYGLGPDPVTGAMVPYYLAKNSGTVELTGRCDSLEVVSLSIALYLPTENPFSDDPPYFGCFPDETLFVAQRIPAGPPCE